MPGVNVALMVTPRDTGIRGGSREFAGNDVLLTGGALSAMASVMDPAAKGTTNIVAATPATAAQALVVAASPDKPRNLRVVFAASWDGGDVVVNGTDQYDSPISETFPSAAGTTTVGTKVFKTVTSATHSVIGVTANTVSVGTGDKLGVKIAVVNPALLFVNGVGEAVVLDTVLNAFTPTTVPNGTNDYILLSST